jgi:hypothetical protein
MGVMRTARGGLLMITGRRQPSSAAMDRFAADQEFAGRFKDLLVMAEDADSAVRQAQVLNAPLTEQRRLALALDAALTAVTRAAYATQRVKIGLRGYDDWIYRRKAKATPEVRTWTAEAERLLTLRERHRLNGIPDLPPGEAEHDKTRLEGRLSGLQGGHGALSR